MAFEQFFFFYLLSRGRDFVRASRDAIIPPFDDDGVTPLVLDAVRDIVKLITHVLDINLLAWGMRSMHTHHQHVGT